MEKLAPLQKMFNYYILNVDPALPPKGTRHSNCTCYHLTTLFGGHKVLQHQHGQWICNSTWPKQPQAASCINGRQSAEVFKKTSCRNSQIMRDIPNSSYLQLRTFILILTFPVMWQLVHHLLFCLLGFSVPLTCELPTSTTT